MCVRSAVDSSGSSSVQLDVPSRWLVHDAFLKKSWRNILPDSGVAGDQCVTLLAALLARDIA